MKHNARKLVLIYILFSDPLIEEIIRKIIAAHRLQQTESKIRSYI